MKKLHITLTDQEFDDLCKMKAYFSNMIKDMDITVPMSYSWVIGSAIRKCYNQFLKQND